MRQIVLDTETTGLDPKLGHRIIEIGGVELIDRRLTGRHFHEYINPEREVEQEALAVHGITNEFLSNKPCFKEIVSHFINFISGAELIIHNAPFDIGFIDYELKLIKAEIKRVQQICQVFDTLVLARKTHPGQRNSLDALCKRYRIDNSQRELHGALLDAEILAQVYLAMTGGQASLFVEGLAQETTAQIDGQVSVPKRIRENLIIIKPTPEELLSHQDIVKTLVNPDKINLWETTD
ncbi:MAG: DNA polymerase III subunit epsilon [Gammaproteobacteria bacterium RIFCSPHIGHO2_12_FULL_35_23]|nr:MAG: DNA polymerase III subunit epsilon [Gammaproteobacteria bacterium RIFCSPHIGHO2_12_FULL_35_23]